MNCLYSECLNDATLGRWCVAHFPLSAESYEIVSLMNRLEASEARAAELAAQLATTRAEIWRLNQQLAQIVINSVRTL